MNKSDIDDEMLAAYLDGEMDALTSRQITDAIADDPDLAARLERLQIPMAAIHQAIDTVSSSASGDALFAGIRAGKREAETPRRSWRPMPWSLGVAASILLAFGIGLLMGQSSLKPASDRD